MLAWCCLDYKGTGTLVRSGGASSIASTLEIYLNCYANEQLATRSSTPASIWRKSLRSVQSLEKNASFHCTVA